MKWIPSLLMAYLSQSTQFGFNLLQHGSNCGMWSGIPPEYAAFIVLHEDHEETKVVHYFILRRRLNVVFYHLLLLHDIIDSRDHFFC